MSEYGQSDKLAALTEAAAVKVLEISVALRNDGAYWAAEELNKVSIGLLRNVQKRRAPLSPFNPRETR